MIIKAETLRSGQPRRYADSENVVRVTVDPSCDTEEDVRRLLRDGRYGFTEQTKSDRPHPFARYLDYLRRVSDGVWEFRTVSPFTG